MKLVLPMIFCLSSLAYAGQDVPFVQNDMKRTITITWITSNDITVDCVDAGLPYRYAGYLGCATVTADGETCTIYTNKHTSHEILGHEIRHCFQGNFHP